MPDLPPDFQAVLTQYDAALGKLSRSQAELLQKVADLQGELARKNDLLAHKERMAVLGELSASIAHEIRNPLGGMRLYVDLLEREIGRPNSSLDQIRRSIARLDRVVRDVLSSAKDITPQLKPGRFAAVVTEAMSLAQPELDAKQIHVDVNVAAFEASFDADLIVRLLLNLVLNAAQELETGGKIGVHVAAAGKGTRLIVEDNGPGVPADRLDKLFTPFFTTKETGTGLGLALCRRIAEAHGGNIRAENRPEGGARFIVEIS
ncbi:MAG: hypothetical protein IT462_09690 [Planctomycetes bacterium]|nr:hypothetical protein [Planctomycetota bacterium]